MSSAAKTTGGAKKAKPKAAKRKANPALMQKFKPDATLAAIVGAKPRPRSQYMKDIWVFIKKEKLQDPKNGQHILAKKNNKFHKWAGKDKITMFEVMSILNKHISE
jgi:chromatin remodeling complex protein RSC6